MRDIDSGLHDLAAIRTIMERASKFLTLSGLSGVGAGVIALAGIWTASGMLGSWGLPPERQDLPEGLPLRLFALGAAVLLLALATTLLFSIRLARRQGQPIWGPATRIVLEALALPFLSGGVLGIVLLFLGHLWLVPGVQLLFYGAGLFAAGSFTFGEIRYLGAAQAALGITSVLLPAQALLFWAAGFGLLHILYGVFLFLRYER